MKILLATMSMDIGGAETHILELAKELKNRGNDVSLVSSGGEYIKELEKCGVKIYSATLNSNHPFKMLKGYRELNKILKEEHFDIVHSHTRISSFLLGLLSKKYKFPFITTDHGAFKVNTLFKMISNWGEYTLAVSEDLKRYLMDNYGLSEDKIAITVNGIDTQKFSKNIDVSSLFNEFDIDSNAYKVVHVSRLDVETTVVTKQLIEASKTLAVEIPNLQVIIVGDGTDYENVKALADEVNKAFNRSVVKLVGKRTDVYRFDAMADVFVGVSRAALEAMSAEKPVIISGSEGYLGILDENTIKKAIDTNFCCRGLETSDVSKIVNDLRRIYSKSTQEIEKMGDFNKNVVIENYSVNKMVNDAEKAYKIVLEMHKK